VIIIRSSFLKNDERENFRRYEARFTGNVEIFPLRHAFLFLFDVKIIMEFLEIANVQETFSCNRFLSWYYIY